VDTATEAAVISAIAAGAAAVAAIGSWFAAWQTARIQGKATDFSNCLEVIEQLGEAQRRVRDADNHDKSEFEFIELLNLLEALALLFTNRKIAPSTRKFTGKFLEEALAWIGIDPEMAKLMQKSMTDDTTYQELKKFRKRRQRPIRGLSRFYRIKRDTAR
jgi:hypothetical protein